MNKILFLLNYPGEGGTEKYVYDIISHYGPEHCVFAYTLDGPLVGKLEKLGVKCIRIRMRHPFDLLAARKLKRVAEQNGISVIHAQFLRENYIAVLAKLLGLRAKVIWTYHVNTPVPFVLNVTNRLFTRFNDQVIAVSHFIKKQLHDKGVAEDKIHVIHNGLQKESNPTDGKTPTIPFVIASIGRLSQEKGHFFLLDALNKLKSFTKEQIQWKCLIVGDGPLKNEIIKKIAELHLTENIQMVGFVEDIDKIYQQSDLIAISSRNDALPYTAIESIYWGKAVVATDIGGIPEVIENGNNGIIVPFGDIPGYAHALYRLMQDNELLAQMGEHGKKRFNESFTFSKMYEQLTSIYNQ